MEEKPASRKPRMFALAAFCAGLFALLLLSTSAQRRQAPDGAPGPGAPQEALAPAETAAATAEDALRFDIIRVEPDGSTVLAGTAPPGARVTIHADGTPIATTTADAAGNFVAFFDAAPTGAPQALSLRAERSDGESVVSEEVVMLFPDAAGATDAAAADAAEGEAAEVAATAILRPDSVDVQPVTDPEAPLAADQVTLGSISYSETGEIVLSGFGPAGAAIRAYVNDEAVRDGRIGDNGRWSLALAEIGRGFYRLRIDQLASEGRVVSRVETPFQRDLPGGPRPRPAAGDEVGVSGVLVTVQPGGTLWTLARAHYGEGMLYTQIFTANRALIRDPNLIYPGQVLAIPEPE